MRGAPEAALAGALLGVAGLLSAGCHEATPLESSVARAAPPIESSAEAAPPAAPAPPPVTVTLLYTSDEHGWLLPVVGKDGALHGGAAEVLGRFIEREGHCVPSRGCVDPGTLLLSGGDNYTGPAISSYFFGAPMADAMAAMGYVASAFGNHEFDFGRARFLQNRARGGVLYLAANVRALDEALKGEMDLPAFSMFERRGVKIGVVGLATETTLTEAMARRFEGVGIDSEEPALERAVAEAWAAGPDALVLIAHECPDKLAPVLARHPDFRFAFVGGGHCHKMMKVDRAVGAPIYSPGWRFESYLRVRLSVDRTRPPRERVVAVEPELVEVSRREDDGAPVDAELASAAADWKAKLDNALGEKVGFAATGFDKDAPEIARWITEAWRSELKVDVAIINTGGIRQALPRGTITKATIWSILPFENKLVICELLGSDLITDLETDEAAFAGVSRQGSAYRLDSGALLDPKRRYRVATIDFLYFGGNNFRFQEQDPKPKETMMDWRVPVIQWTRAQKTSPTAPLERKMGPRSATPPKKSPGALAHP